MEEFIKDEVYIKKLNLDTASIKNSCEKVYNILSQVNKNYHDDEFSPASNSTKLWKHYNTFFNPYDGFYELFDSIRQTFYEIKPREFDGKYYIQSWINCYQKGEYIDWHSHSNTPDRQFMTGYYSVSGEPSFTTFRYQDGIEYNVYNKEDNLVFTKMGGQYRYSEHRTWPWDQDQPRISIAFEIIHREGIPQWFPKEEMFNHWMPI